MFCSAIVFATSAAVLADADVAVILTTSDSAAEKALAAATAVAAGAAPPKFGARTLLARALIVSERTSASRSGPVLGVTVPNVALPGPSGGSRNNTFAEASKLGFCCWA